MSDTDVGKHAPRTSRTSTAGAGPPRSSVEYFKLATRRLSHVRRRRPPDPAGSRPHPPL